MVKWFRVPVSDEAVWGAWGTCHLGATFVVYPPSWLSLSAWIALREQQWAKWTSVLKIEVANSAVYTHRCQFYEAPVFITVFRISAWILPILSQINPFQAVLPNSFKILLNYQQLPILIQLHTAVPVLYYIQVSPTNELNQDSVNKLLLFKEIKLKWQIHTSKISYFTI
jgi:hypothetical protein